MIPAVGELALEIKKELARISLAVPAVALIFFVRGKHQH